MLKKGDGTTVVYKTLMGFLWYGNRPIYGVAQSFHIEANTHGS